MKIIRAEDVEVTFEKAPPGADYKWTTTLRVRVKDHDKTLFMVMIIPFLFQVFLVGV